MGVGVAGAAVAADPVEQGRRGTPTSEELPATPTAAWSVSSLQAPLHLSGCRTKPAGCPQGRWVGGRDQHGTPHPNTAAQPWLPALVMGLFNPQLCQAARYFLVHLVISGALTDSNVWLASHRRLIRS